MPHKAQAIVQACIDFRFRQAVNDFIENELNLHSVDLKTDGGGVKMIFEEGPVRDWIMANYQIAFDLHAVERVVLINHTDCGAYGGSKAHATAEDEIRHHEVQLRHAVSIVRAKFPNKQIDAYLAVLAEDGNISFNKII